MGIGQFKQTQCVEHVAKKLLSNHTRAYTSNNQPCHPDSQHPHKPNKKWAHPMSQEHALRTASNPGSNEMEDFPT